jgi:hypothetical protein
MKSLPKKQEKAGRGVPRFSEMEKKTVTPHTFMTCSLAMLTVACGRVHCCTVYSVSLGDNLLKRV